jgi:hypothetical protein
MTQYDCVDKNDPPVRTLEEIGATIRDRELRLALLCGVSEQKYHAHTKPVFSDKGERWNSMRDFAMQFGVDPGTGYQYICKGVRFRGRKLAYKAFSRKQLTGGGRRLGGAA